MRHVWEVTGSISGPKPTMPLQVLATALLYAYLDADAEQSHKKTTSNKGYETKKPLFVNL
jgi:hypothetical protein